MTARHEEIADELRRAIGREQYTVGSRLPSESELAAHYGAQGADELIFLDITATSDKRATVVELARRAAEFAGVAPDAFEFWQGRPSRLHDRLAYARAVDGSWRMQRLAP